MKKKSRNDEEGRVKQTPLTQETKRILTEDLLLKNNPEINEEESFDEFCKFIKGDDQPKVLLTTNLIPTRFTFEFLTEIKNLMPNAFYYPRKKFKLSKICE